MKKILVLILVCLSLAGFSQLNQVFKPGYTLSTGALDSLVSGDTSFSFVFKNPVSAYCIQISPADTLIGNTPTAQLYGSNWTSEWTPIGDTLVLDTMVGTFTTGKVWTGTTFPYAIGKIVIPDSSITRGALTIKFFYY